MALVQDSTTQETAAHAAVASLGDIAKRSWNNHLNDWQQAIRSVWLNPKATPQSQFDVMGADAVKNVDGSAATVAYLTAQSATYFGPEGHAANLQRLSAAAKIIKPFSKNPDGTVTVTTTPPAAPAA